MSFDFSFHLFFLINHEMTCKLLFYTQPNAKTRSENVDKLKEKGKKEGKHKQVVIVHYK